MSARCVARDSLNSVQGTSRKFRVFLAFDRSIDMSMMLMIGKWSVIGGRIDGSTSHVMKGLCSACEHHTLSGLVQFRVVLASRVGIPSGNAMFMPYLLIRSRSGSTIRVFWYRCLLHGSSQKGW